MIHEYAVDPNSVSSFNEIWQALEQFGVGYGRMLVGCPKKWWEIVKRNLAEAESRMPPAEYKELEERCFRLKEKRILIYRSNLKFDGDKSKTWVQGLLPEHRERPFRAVLQLEPELNEEIPILGKFDFRDKNPLWRVERTITVPRNDVALAKAVTPLLRISSDLLVIDPYFSGEDRHCSTLKHMLEGTFESGGRLNRVEVHTRTQASSGFLEGNIRRFVHAKLAECPEIQVFKWSQKSGGERLHDRFILTDRGGFEFPGGTDSGEEGQTTSVHLLDNEAYLLRWKQYQPETAAFKLVESFCVPA